MSSPQDFFHFRGVLLNRPIARSEYISSGRVGSDGRQSNDILHSAVGDASVESCMADCGGVGKLCIDRTHTIHTF